MTDNVIIKENRLKSKTILFQGHHNAVLGVWNRNNRSSVYFEKISNSRVCFHHQEMLERYKNRNR